mgnify:CR=1 FL=1
MVLYRTAIVQGLSSTRGPEGGRKNRQSFFSFNSVTLKDTAVERALLRVKSAAAGVNDVVPPNRKQQEGANR